MWAAFLWLICSIVIMCVLSLHVYSDSARCYCRRHKVRNKNPINFYLISVNHTDTTDLPFVGTIRNNSNNNSKWELPFQLFKVILLMITWCRRRSQCKQWVKAFIDTLFIQWLLTRNVFKHKTLNLLSHRVLRSHLIWMRYGFLLHSDTQSTKAIPLPALHYLYFHALALLCSLKCFSLVCA